jgi:hypothetical protein
MVRFTRVLPGELEGRINPKDYGFDVVPSQSPGKAEEEAQIADLYAQVKARTGKEIPKLEPYLALATTDAADEEHPRGKEDQIDE